MAIIQDLKFTKFVSGGETRIGVELKHTAKSRPWINVGYIVAKPAVSYVPFKSDLKGMLETRGITLKMVGDALAAQR